MSVFVRPAQPGHEWLLFVHGLGESGLCFRSFAERPEWAGWGLLIPDLPGYGRSPRPAHPLSFDQMVDLLALWLADRGCGPPVVIGHSMGGVIGRMLAQKHAHTVRALIDIEGNIGPDDCVYSRPAAVADTESFLEREFPEFLTEIERRSHNSPAFAGYHQSLRLADPRSFQVHARELVRRSDQGELAALLAELPVPRLYLAGLAGGVSEASLQRLDEQGILWREVEEAGHWPFIDRPGETAALVSEFLAESTNRRTAT